MYSSAFRNVGLTWYGAVVGGLGMLMDIDSDTSFPSQMLPQRFGLAAGTTFAVDKLLKRRFPKVFDNISMMHAVMPFMLYLLLDPKHTNAEMSHVIKWVMLLGVVQEVPKMFGVPLDSQTREAAAAAAASGSVLVLSDEAHRVRDEATRKAAWATLFGLVAWTEPKNALFAYVLLALANVVQEKSGEADDPPAAAHASHATQVAKRYITMATWLVPMALWGVLMLPPKYQVGAGALGRPLVWAAGKLPSFGSGSGGSGSRCGSGPSGWTITKAAAGGVAIAALVSWDSKQNGAIPDHF